MTCRHRGQEDMIATMTVATEAWCGTHSDTTTSSPSPTRRRWRRRRQRRRPVTPRSACYAAAPDTSPPRRASHPPIDAGRRMVGTEGHGRASVAVKYWQRRRRRREGRQDDDGRHPRFSGRRHGGSQADENKTLRRASSPCLTNRGTNATTRSEQLREDNRRR